MGFGVLGFRVGVWGLGFGVWGLGLRLFRLDPRPLHKKSVTIQSTTRNAKPGKAHVLEEHDPNYGALTSTSQPNFPRRGPNPKPYRRRGKCSRNSSVASTSSSRLGQKYLSPQPQGFQWPARGSCSRICCHATGFRV